MKAAEYKLVIEKGSKFKFDMQIWSDGFPVDLSGIAPSDVKLVIIENLKQSYGVISESFNGQFWDSSHPKWNDSQTPPISAGNVVKKAASSELAHDDDSDVWWEWQGTYNGWIMVSSALDESIKYVQPDGSTGSSIYYFTDGDSSGGVTVTFPNSANGEILFEIDESVTGQMKTLIPRGRRELATAYNYIYYIEINGYRYLRGKLAVRV